MKTLLTRVRQTAIAMCIVAATGGTTIAVSGVAHATGGDRLSAGQQLTAGQQITAGAYRVVMQSDGNLVEYTGSTAVWASGTSGSGSRAVMQTDGNFVIYNSANTVLWSSGTAPTSGDQFVVQTDGNVVIYSAGTAIWASPWDAVRKAALKVAIGELGVPYVWAGSTPSGFDCSGLTMYSWAKEGVALPHSSAGQYNYGRHVTKGQLQPGDLVFFASNTSDPSTIHHVGIYAGWRNGQQVMIDALEKGTNVEYDTVMTRSDYIGAVRLYG